jgi:hypothetical protein
MPRGLQVQICRMRELSRPFENDDEDAAAAAIGILNESVAEAKTRAAQDEAIHRVKGFLEHEREAAGAQMILAAKFPHSWNEARTSL